MSLESATKVEGEYNLEKEFRYCEDVVDDLDSGRFSSSDLQNRLKECAEKLERLTQEVSARSLFSTNETVGELPTRSLQYFLIPSYFATVVQNIFAEPENRLEVLDRAKAYLREFLEVLLLYEVIGFDLPWLREDAAADGDGGRPKVAARPSATQIRENKMRRFQQQKQMEENLARLNAERRLHTDDDSLLRELLLVRLQLFALKAMNELEQIEEERPLAEHVLKMRSGKAKPEPKKPRPPPMMPVIVTRDELQKKVLGLGYPSVPTMTVDEWYSDMAKHGRFAGLDKGESSGAPPRNLSDSENEDDESTEEARRARAQQWDEYKDSHRRGWGNVHNKG